MEYCKVCVTPDFVLREESLEQLMGEAKNCPRGS
jgi:hypothetical protein